MYLDVMLIDKCNLTCRMCRHYQNTTGKVMSLEQYDIILNQFSNLRIMGQRVTGIRLDGNREALLYPHLEQALMKTKEHGLSTFLITNGTLLSKDKSKMLIERELDMIGISITGITPDVYRFFQGSGNRDYENQLQTVIENVKYLLALKESAKSKVIVEIYYIVNEHSIYDADAAVPFWKKCGVNYIRFSSDSNKNVGLRKSSQSNLTYFPGGMCITTAVINTYGDVYPCCQPAGEKMSLGNCFEKPLGEIFSSDRYFSFASALTGLEQDKLPEGCKACGAICEVIK